MTAQKPQAGYKAEKILDALLSEDDSLSSRNMAMHSG